MEYLRVKELLSEKNISGKELAQKVGVSTNAISQIATGKTQPRFELMEKIAEVLGVEIRDLFQPSKGDPIYKKVEGEYIQIGELRNDS
ncbi:MAG: transcriptional regulator [Flavobacteriales bacterium]|nr:transcriptional regulator [Flavobacteriales bacterium]